ncbi:filamentous hemagglutinin [Janthinobacterium sp. HH103]|uniref:two-partner secretion domain-containing protein n=1 Tax=unclassified Janthinobacterium TaxID=2610881 RepID=UPI0008745B27|nr:MULTISPECIES: hemagglutinin repeat-containing protein [unclassified Janthinobacterium]OEZ65950.1 filamentous hemagglutinin [Janthinobacterium sp. HH100]OEZ74808.1 filamentous hemagglutinin [Janthinobacterium sp. HH103]QOU73366.1 Hemagglutinin repeat protein [Janthinobacterium sp. HH102]
MNKHLYRIIFNQRRGQLMVVGENATSQGKAPGGESVMNDGAGGGGAELTLATLRPACLAVFSALGMLLFVTGAAHGQVVADRNAPGGQRPTVLQTANGIPQVNIQTPSGAGVSRNTYSQFDVQSNGVILNNSRGNTQTQTGGWVQGNPWLAGGSARVILNEVNSANPSQLRGYVEVAGQRAEVIIANPSGVAVDGGGFINASRVTLTTGSPIVNGGNLDGYVVQRGMVTVSGRGLDTSQSDYTSILARAVQVNAGIWANDLRVVTGANRMDANHAVETAASGDGAKPAFALDVAQLGGMYAGKITLIGTEAGIGTRNAGTVAASVGNVVLHSDGWISNSGYIQSGAEGGQVQASAAGDLQNAGTIYAAGDTGISSGGDISNNGVIAAAGNTALHGGGRVDSAAGAVLAAGLNADNMLRPTGDLTVEANAGAGIHGIGAAGNTVRIAATAVDLAGANLSARQLSAMASQGDLDARHAGLAARDTLALQTTRLLRTDGAQATGGEVSIAAHDISNVGGQILQLGEGDLALRLPGQLDNSAGRIATNSHNLTVDVAELVNTGGKIEHAGTGALAIHAASLANQRGQITGNGDLALAADAVDHREATTLARHLTVQAGTLDNRGGSLIQTGTEQTTVDVARGLENSGGRLETNGSLGLSAASVLSEHGRIAAAQAVNMNVAGGLNNTGGVLAAGLSLTLNAGDVNNTRGQIQAVSGAASLAIGDLQNTAGSVFAAGDLAIAAGKVDNSGSLYAGAHQTLKATGAIVNTGVIAAQGNATLQAASLDSSASSLLGAGVKADGGLLATGDLRVTTAQALLAKGQNLAAGQLALSGAALDLTGSQTGAANIALTATQGDVLTRQALLTTPGTLAVTAGAHAGQTLVNEQGQLSAGQLDLQLSNLDNRRGTVVQTGTGDTRIVLSMPAGVLDNTSGRIAVNSANATLDAGKLMNTDGKLEHAGNGTLALHAATLDGERGSILGNGLVRIDAGIMRHDQASTVGQQVTLQADSLSNRGGHVLQTGDAAMTVATTGQLDNSGGEIGGNGGVQVRAGVLDNSKGRITSAAAASVASKGAVNNTDGVLAATTDLQVGGAALDNTRGVVQTGTGALALDVASLLNQQGTLSAGTDLAAKVGGDLNNSGLLYAGRDQLLVVGGTLGNSGSLAAGRDVSVQAGSIDSSGLLGAGMRADGTLGQAGSLVVTATQALRATGQNLAGGDAVLDGAALDLTGSQSSAANIALTAHAGDVLTSQAQVSTAGLLAITANGNNGQVLVNAGGQLSAGQLALAAANVRNVKGTIVQSGAGSTVIDTGVLDNTGGRIAVNSGNLSLGAGALTNIDGKIEHAGTGTLAIRATNLYGQRGQISGNGALVVTADSFDHRDGALLVRQVTLHTGTLDNRQGSVTQTGTGSGSVAATGHLDNRGGKIEGNGDMALSADMLLNQNGRLAFAGAAEIVTGSLDNTDGGVLAGGLNIRGGDVNNTRGQIQAVSGAASLAIGDLRNTAGSVFAAGDLAIAAGKVDNSGSLYAGAHQTLKATGAIVNTGVIAAQGNATIQAASLDSSASSLLGAGVKADGGLLATGDLRVTTAQALLAKGQNLAAGQLALSGAALDLTGSQTGAANIALTATQGDVLTRQALLTTPGTLAVTAGAHAGQTLVNEQGQLSAGQLDLQLSNLDNRRGTVVQTGTGDTRIVLSMPAGVLDNTSGRIAVNSANATLDAGKLMNTDGKLEHAGNGTLALHAATLDGERGSILGNGLVRIDAGIMRHDQASTVGQQVTLQADSLSNRGGHVLQTGDAAMTVATTGQLDNSGGEIGGNGGVQVRAGVLDNSKGRITSAAAASVASKGAVNNTDGVLAATTDLQVGGAALDNTRGVVQTGTGALALDVASLLNQQGTLSAGTDLAARVSGDLNNSGLLYAGRDQQLTVGGLLNNTASIAAANHTTISAGSVTSSGLLGAGMKADGSLGTAGNLTVNADGVLQANGQNLAAGSAVLMGSSVDLSASQTGAGNIAITARSGDVLTNKAVISASNVLAITANANNAQALVNSQGQLVAGQLQLNVANLDNASGDIVQTGTGDTVITTGKLDNTAGRIAVNSNNLALNATVLTNLNGKLEHAGAGILAINAGQFNNQFGKITGNGKLDITAVAFDHRNATTVANQMTVNAGSLDNRAGSLAQTGAGMLTVTATGQLDNTGGKIESNGDALVKAGALLNNTGRVVAAQDVELKAGSLDNTEGTVAAGRHLVLNGGDIDNTKGQLQAVAGNATLNVGKLHNTAGSVFAGANLNATLSSLNNTGSMYAAGNQSITASGGVANTGVIAAQGNTSLAANSLDSSASSLIGAGMQADGKLGTVGDLTINTAHMLAAHGQNLAAGVANLSGANVDITGSQTGATQISLAATSGDVLAAKAVVSTPGTLTVRAHDTLRNTEGQLSAGQLDLHVGHLDNTKGTVIQTGTGDTVIQTGKLDNSVGRIAVNSNNLILGAASLTNAGGKIEHAGAGTLAITAATLQGAGGSIIGNGAVDLKAGLFDHANATTTGRSLSVQADSLSNRGGHLLQTGVGGMTVAVSGQLDNTNGEMAGNGVLSLQTGSLDNTKGKITSATSADIVSTGALVNTDGVIAAATDLHLGGAIDNTRGLLQAGTGALSLDAASVRNVQGTLGAGTDITAKVSGDVLNAGVLYAGRNQTLEIGGLLSNTGSLAALGNTAITAGSLGGNGLLAAGMRADGSFASAGDLTVKTAGALQAGGQNMAAGQLQLTGGSVDVGGSQTSAANVGLTAFAGNVTTSKAIVSTNGLLAITANAANGQALVNQSGSLSAGQLALRVANLDNTKGTLIQTGTGDTVIETGKLDNTGGRIAVNSANLRLQAGDLTNIDGKIEHAGKGLLDIRATHLYGQRGQLTGNGALQVAADYVDHRNASTIARQLTVTSGALDNRQGEIIQLGTDLASIVATRSLDNSGGKIEGNGDVQVETATLLNDHGRLVSAQNLGVNASTALNNTEGNILGGRKLTLRGGAVDNTRGQIQALDGNAELAIGDLNNNGGKVFASIDLNTVAANVVNSGSLYAGANQTLRASGDVSNTGTILAQGHNTINAGSLTGSASSLLAAGVKADGSLLAAGNLNVTTAQALRASGQNLAAGNMVFSGATVDVTGSQTSASNIALNASAGDVSTSGAVVTTLGTLEVHAANHYGQRWENGRGQVSAGQLTVQVANLGNVQGSIIQTGSGASSLNLTSPGGVLDNTSGRIAVNSVSLNLNAGVLANTDGKIEHAGSGTLTMHAGQISGQRGQITSNGSLDMTAAALDHRNASTIAQQVTISSDTLDNRQGNITQLGLGQTAIGASQSLDNRGGTIASNGSTSIAAYSLNNQGGTLQAAGSGSLDIRGGGTLDNSKSGVIAAGGNFTAAVGELLNQGGKLTAGGTLHASAAQVLRNEAGLLAATGNVELAAGFLDNTGGKVATVAGNLNVISGGVLKNDGGTLQAVGDITLRSADLSNTVAAGQDAAGMIVGKNIRIDTGLWALDNHLGTIAASETLSVYSGPLTNDGGLLQSGAGMRIDTRGQVLSNGSAGAYAARNQGNAGGIVSGGDAVLSIGSWNNTAGYFGAAGAISGTTGLINNAGGQIVGQSSLALSGAGLDNQNGQIQVVGKLSFATPGGIDNRNGLIRSGATVSLTAGTIDNSTTQGSNQGIEAINAILTTGSLSNRAGALRTDGNLDIVGSGVFDNTQGLASAGRALSVADLAANRSLAIINTGGTVIAGALADVRAASLTGDGRLLSQLDMNLDLSGGYSHGAGAELVANRNLGIATGGQFLNMGKVRAGGTLTLRTNSNIDNTAYGDISATITRLSAGGLLVNRGVIDGVATEINANIIHNIGTGRIYGDQLSIGAGTLNNDVENGVAATIAARNDLQIGAQTINNFEHALIFSANSLSIGGSIDGNRQATGRTAVLNNASATIEALGSLSMSAAQINNLNKHIQMKMSSSTKQESVTEYQGAGAAKRYVAGTPGVETYDDESLHLRTPDGTYEVWTLYKTTRTSRQSEIVSSDPGRIIAGGNISISADLVANEDSHIIAGGLLDMHGSRIRNGQTQGQKISTDKGTATLYKRKFKKGRDSTSIGKPAAFTGAEKTESITLNIAREEQFATPQGSGISLSGAATGGVNASTSAAGAASAQVQGKAIVSVLAGLAGVANAAGRQAGAASGGSGPNGTTRVAGAGLGGTVGSVSGSAVDAVQQGNGPTGAYPGAIALGTAATGAMAQEVQHVGGTASTTGTDRLGQAGQGGFVRTVAGALAATVTGSNQLGQVSLASGSTTSIGNASGGVSAATGVGGVPGAARGAGVTEAALGVLPADMQVGRVTGADAHGQASLAPAGSTSIGNASGTAAQAAGLGGVPGQTRLPGIAQVALTDASGRAQFVRTSSPSTALPNASLFRTLPSLSSRYLVETDPRFANFREWTGSDYLLNQVKVDPSVTQKRLGDGFYEQKLIREQVAQLTGQRFVGDYTNDEQQYRALMDAGVAYAKNYDLHPGVALTAEQMAALTSDIVWLVERDVALPDGSVQKALVPQIYLRLREGDLDGSGALLAGKDININLSGDLTNSGTIAGRSVVKLTADNVENMGGRLNGDAVAVAARNDLNNIGGTISANSELIATAGRDIHIASTTQSASSSAGGNSFSRTDIDRVAGLYVTGDGSSGGGTLVVSAGRDVSMLAGVIGNAGKDGQTIVNAGRDINLGTLTTASSSSLSWDAKNYRKDSSSTEVGSQIQGSGSIVLQAGNDLTARAADVQAGAGLSVTAGHDIVLSAGANQLTVDEGHVQTGKGFLNKKTITTRDMLDLGTSAGSAFGGATVAFAAGNDIKLTGAQILSDGSASLLAKNDISIGAASETSKELHHRDVKESGFMSGGGFGFSYGTRTTTTDQERDAVIQSGQARSTVGSTSGALTIVAGKDLKIGGSDIVAATDLNLAGTSVKITPGQDSDKGKFETKTTQDGFTVALGGSVVSAIQTLQTMSTAASTAKNSRVTAMAAATTAMAANAAAKDMMKEGGPSISISLTAGHSESQQTQTTASTTHSGSVLTGNNINITATGGGKDSNITILGSDLNAKNDIRLHADNNVNLLAAQDTESQHSKSSSMSASVGVQAIVSTKGTSFGFTASLSGSKGHEDGDGTTQLNTHVNAGDKLIISSGGDTNIKGAVASANQVIADIKGNLNLESLQDTAKFDSKSQSISASGTVGFGASVSGSYSQSNMHNDYASVQEQSGIKAGDGGFQIKVGGNTDLKGAVISATEAGKLGSSLVTSTLTHSDIANHAISKGSSVGVSGGFSVAGKETEENKNLTNVGGKGGTTAGLPAIVALSENASSTTRSGISGGTLVITDDAAQRAATGKGADEAIAGVNRDVTTGVDSSGKIGNNFDKAALQATMDVTAAFAAAAAKEVGDYADKRLAESKELAKQANDEKDPVKKAELLQQSKELAETWKEGGFAKTAMHTAIGGIVGGAGGALGAGAAEMTTQALSGQIAKLGLPKELHSALLLAASASVGAAVGGGAGANSALNEVANNYLNHNKVGIKNSEQEQYDAARAACKSSSDPSCKTAEALAKKSEERDALLTSACAVGPTEDCAVLTNRAIAYGNRVIYDHKNLPHAISKNEPMLQAIPDYRAGTYHYTQAASLRDGMEMAATDFLIGKALGGIAAGGKYVYDGLASSAKGIAPALGEAVFKYAERTGVIFYAVENTGVSTVKNGGLSQGANMQPSVASTSVADARNTYMGRTPDKFSRAGSEVLERMRSDGMIVGDGPLLRGNPNNLELVTPKGPVRIDETIDMAHRTDAVTWWNSTGRFFGSKAPEVRQFMLNSDNYMFQMRSENRSAGASLGVTYLPPVLPKKTNLKR